MAVTDNKVYGGIPMANSFFRPFWQKQGTAVAGTWAWGTNASQTNFASLTGEGAGSYNNSTTHTDLNEYKWSDIFLTKGTYTITIYYIKSTDRGIAEILFGTTSLGTIDMYAAAPAYNNTTTVTFTLNTDTTADLRFRVNGLTAPSTDHIVGFSRFQIEKVA